MSKNDREPEHPILPALDFDDEDYATLTRAPVELAVDGDTLRGTAEVRLDLTPTPRIHLYCDFDDSSQGVLYMKLAAAELSVERRVKLGGLELNVIGSWSQHRLPGGLSIKWTPVKTPVQVLGNGRTQMQRTVSHIFGLFLRGDFGSWQRQGDTRFGIEHIDLEHGTWRARARTLPSTRANRKAIRETGAQRLTHVLEVSQSGHQPYTGAEVDECLEALRNFLTFATGKPCRLSCPSGFDSQGQAVWSRWSSPEPWGGRRFCWFGHNGPAELSGLFQGFMDRWTSQGWQETLATAIWWYTVANSSSTGLVQGVVAAQIAIESLSYQFCVPEKGLISEQGFKDLRAADKMRLLFSSIGVPTDIPPSARRLVSESQGRNWADVPHALTYLRNKVVHGGPGRSSLPDGVYVDAWLLAVWSLEMAILALCGFTGEHWNRVTRETEPVPWASN